MVIMASGIARGRVRTTTTTTTESRTMAAVLQITGWQRDMQPWFTLYFFGIGHPFYDQLTPVKKRYPLTSITWPYRRLKLIAHRGQVFFWSWPLTRCWFFDWIGGSYLVNLLKTGQDCSGGLFGKPVNAHPGSNINQTITLSSMLMFLLLFVYMVIIETQNRRPNNIQKTSVQSYTTQIKILLFPGLA